MLAITAPQIYAQVSVGISISANIAPPALPVYTQPVCPNDGYIWTPGYWAYDDNDGYYWVPGVWVAPPQPGVLWTPAYWGFVGGVYGFHAGYWGPHVGFYGGINYGFGYGGVGFGGGVWAGNSFRYNTAVTNVNTTIVHNTYVNNTVINNTTVNNHTSFNGAGGVNAMPNAQERSAMNEQHIQPTSNQMSHQQSASQDHNQFASVNHGSPGTTAMSKVGGTKFNQQGHIANRAANQQQRIASGVRDGQMNAGQVAKTEKREQNINRNVHADRQANGGKLNAQQKGQINRQQNRASKQIAKQRHDK